VEELLKNKVQNLRKMELEELNDSSFTLKIIENGLFYDSYSRILVDVSLVGEVELLP
jgi:hypothetical protein